ncbi:MAG: tRNA (adenosine(37)-N6)-dimethylallyltransferase MiaA [Clostridia bacterium]|nr:tRNA (adenosine(37)-N6)-dimethylallyltransferase MiaA [Clostridia bacterium]
MKKEPLIILTGPTAVGKTSLSIELAKAVNGQIISADSMQVYKYMDIGTAKITEEEMQGVKHFLVDVIEPKDGFDVAAFKHMALDAISVIRADGHIPVIVGGTGFYIQALLYDAEFEEEESDSGYRKQLQEIADKQGAQTLHNMLREVDEASADAIHANNVKRVIRALEFFKKTGKKISEHNEEQRLKESPYNFCYFVLNDKREVLYDRINRRVDTMFDAGLIDEVKNLAGQGFTKNDVAMQGIGYKEVFDYLNGECSEEELKEIVKQDTRHFAKRQLTWFRREPSVTWVDLSEYNSRQDVLAYMLEQLKEKGIV